MNWAAYARRLFSANSVWTGLSVHVTCLSQCGLGPLCMSHTGQCELVVLCQCRLGFCVTCLSQCGLGCLCILLLIVSVDLVACACHLF